MAKYAFLVGINKFRGGNIDGQDLRGCVNDVIQTRDMLVSQFGFADSDIRLLVDERATKQEIWNRLIAYSKQLRPGDLFVFHMSSHGTRYALRDRRTGKIGKVVDILCASNFTWDDPLLIGPNIGQLFSKVPNGASVVFIIDACHAGAQFKSAIATEKLPAIERSLPRYIPPPIDIQHRFRGVGQNPSPGSTPANVILLSACDKDETAADAYIDKRYCGAFTYHLWKAVKDIPGQENYIQVRDLVRANIAKSRFAQHPGLECSPADSKRLYLNGSVVTKKKENKPILKTSASGFFTGYQ